MKTVQNPGVSNGVNLGKMLEQRYNKKLVNNEGNTELNTLWVGRLIRHR